MAVGSSGNPERTGTIEYLLTCVTCVDEVDNIFEMESKSIERDGNSLPPLVLRGSSINSGNESLVWINEDSDDESIDSFPTFPTLVVRSNNTDTDDLSFATTAADTCEESEDEWDSDSEK